MTKQITKKELNEWNILVLWEMNSAIDLTEVGNIIHNATEILFLWFKDKKISIHKYTSTQRRLMENYNKVLISKSKEVGYEKD